MMVPPQRLISENGYKGRFSSLFSTSHTSGDFFLTEVRFHGRTAQISPLKPFMRPRLTKQHPIPACPRPAHGGGNRRNREPMPGRVRRSSAERLSTLE